MRIISVKVIPNAKKSEIVSEENGVLKIRLHASPEKGKANAALIAFLAEEFQVPKTNITIVKGHTSSNKMVKIYS
jgi:uncharacterized protein (TIGR00251 family)